MHYKVLEGQTPRTGRTCPVLTFHSKFKSYAPPPWAAFRLIPHQATMEHIFVAAVVAIVKYVVAPVAVPFLKRRLKPKRNRTRKP